MLPTATLRSRCASLFRKTPNAEPDTRLLSCAYENGSIDIQSVVGSDIDILHIPTLMKSGGYVFGHYIRVSGLFLLRCLLLRFLRFSICRDSRRGSRRPAARMTFLAAECCTPLISSQIASQATSTTYYVCLHRRNQDRPRPAKTCVGEYKK